MGIELEFYTDEVLTEYNTALEQAIKEAALIVEADAKRNAPVGVSGHLRDKITNEVRKIANKVIEGRVGTNVEYAKYVELGTDPHFPPPDELADWAAKKGMKGAEFAIAKKISREGTEPQPFLRPALRDNFEKIVSIIQEAIE